MRKSKIERQNKRLKREKDFKIFIIILLITLLAFFTYGILASIGVDVVGVEDSNNVFSTIDEENVDTISQNIKNAESNNLDNIFKSVSKSIVGISKLKEKGDTIFLPDSSAKLGLGSGCIVSEDGLILTTADVTGDVDSTCYVTTCNGITYEGTVLWSDKSIDLSIVKIESTDLDFLQIGNSDNLKFAENLYAFGNSAGFEFQRSIILCSICGLNRTIKTISDSDEISFANDIILTDAIINSENRGGPLINKNGELVGINSQKLSSENGFSCTVPVNTIKSILKNLQNDKNYLTPHLGVFAFDNNIIPYIMQVSPVDKTLKNGIYTIQIQEGSPAGTAGLREGDILLTIDDIELNKMSDLRNYIYTKNVGDIVNIKYLRDGTEQFSKIELSE